MSYAPRPAVGVGARHSPSPSGSVGSKRGPPVSGSIVAGAGEGGGGNSDGGGGGGGVAGGVSGGVGGTGASGIAQPLRHGGSVSQKSSSTGHMASGVGQTSKPIAAYRSLELCEMLKHEINSIAAEIRQHHQERDEYEKKFRQQILEMEQIQHSLKQLQEDHMVMKQQYADEIVRLRHKLDHSHKGDSDGRAGSNLPQGASGGLSMGSTGPGQSYNSSPPPQGGVKGLGGIGGPTLASPRKQQGQPGPGMASLRGPMLSAPSNQLMAGGGGAGGQHIVLPGMANRGRGGPGNDEYGIGGRSMGPNGHTVEPLLKRPRLGDPPGQLGPGGGVYLPHGGHHGPHGFGHNSSLDGQQQQQHHHHPALDGPRAPAGMGAGPDGSHRLVPPGMSGGGGLDSQYRGPGGSAAGMGGGPGGGNSRLGAGMGEPGRDGPPSSLGRSGNGASTVGGGGGGTGAVDIPDAIPAELIYEVRYEADTGADRDRGRRGAGGLAVELAKSQDLRSVVCCVRFSTDGTKVAAGSHSCVKVFDVLTFRQLYVCRKVQETQVDPEADPYVRAVCFSPDGLSIVAGMEKNSARVLLLEEGGGRQGPITLAGHESEVYSLDWVSTMIASGSGDGRIRLWDSDSGALQASLGDMAGPQDGVTSVVLKQDTRMVAAASIDRIVHVWSTQTHKLLHRLDGHTESVYAVTFSHDGNTLVSGGLDKTIKVWDLGPGSEGRLSPPAQTLPGGHSDYVLSVCFSQDGKYIISGSKDRSVTIWDAKLMKRVATITGFRNSVIGVSASPTKGTFATGSGDNLVCVWNYGERSVGAAPLSAGGGGGGGVSNSAGGGAADGTYQSQRRGPATSNAKDVCSKESEANVSATEKSKGIEGGGLVGGMDGRKRGNEGGRESAMERDGRKSAAMAATVVDGARSSFGDRNKPSTTVGDSKEGPAPKDGPPSNKSMNPSSDDGAAAAAVEAAARRRSPARSDGRSGHGHGHGCGTGPTERDRERGRWREGRGGAGGGDHDKRNSKDNKKGGQEGRRREVGSADAGDERSPKKKAAGVSGVSGRGLRGAGGPGSEGSGRDPARGSGGSSPERRSLPPKKDVHRRDSPPEPEP